MSARVMTTRILRGGAKDDGRFDLEFWQRQGAEAIFAASWDLVNEARAMRGQSGDEPRLSRDHLLRNKRAVNRLQDQLDVERLTRDT